MTLAEKIVRSNLTLMGYNSKRVETFMAYRDLVRNTQDIINESMDVIERVSKDREKLPWNKRLVLYLLGR